ncbi:hypothetical protein GCM10023259_018360 [Thermocatellispora tengchongensis]
MRALIGPQHAEPAERLRWIEANHKMICHIEADLPRAANTAGGLAQRLAARLLDGFAGPEEINACFRGLPANPTTEMDLALWRLAMTARTDPAARAVVAERDAGRLAKAYQRGELPDSLQRGMRAFLTRYGCRVAAEMDLGLPRWADDPTPVFGTLISYVDAADTGFDASGDGDSGHRAKVRERRAVYTQEMSRSQVPSVVLSDGTIPEYRPASAGGGVFLHGLAGSSGIASGPARIVHDPETARIEPGEVLVCPSRDPGWTPLFLNAAALVTETGGMISHGTTVAREYGIPAVVGAAGATTRIRDGQVITVDGSRGTISLGGHER